MFECLQESSYDSVPQGSQGSRCWRCVAGTLCVAGWGCVLLSWVKARFINLGWCQWLKASCNSFLQTECMEGTGKEAVGRKMG